jgi:cysteine desulfurase / selenocysteine lyase
MVKEAFRSEMPVVHEHAYFDHAAVAPLPAAAAERLRWFADQASHSGDKHWLEWSLIVAQLRTAAARLLGASECEVALVPNTTIGINLVAEGFPWKSGDNLVLPDNEFPSNLLPWKNLHRRGVEIRTLSVPENGQISLDQLVELIDSRTRIVALSWVGFASGYRLNLYEVAEAVHRRGALLFVDAIQGLGAFPINVNDYQIDFLAADGHKWMLGPEGAGLLYIRMKHLELVEPLLLGWNSLADGGFNPSSTKLKSSAARYEGGSYNMAGLLAFEASLELLLRLGTNRVDSPIASAILENVATVANQLKAKGFDLRVPPEEFRSGILTTTWPGAKLSDLNAARKHCVEQNVILSVRAGRIRIATHAYNNAEDIDRLIAALVEARQLFSN